MYLAFAKLYQAQEKRYQAIEVLDSALVLFQASNSLPQIRDAYFLQSKILEEGGDFAGALQSFQHFNALKDTLINEESTRKLVELQTKYQINQKEQQIEGLKERQVQERNIRIYC